MRRAAMKILLRGARVVDPAGGLTGERDLLVEGDRIAAVERDLGYVHAPALDLAGRVVVPGLIDLHVHLRDPGLTEKEDIASGGRSAAAGGFTSIVCMPNTDPPIDSAEVVQYVRERAAEEAPVNVYVAGAITRGLKGRELSDLESLAAAGVVLFTDDGEAVMKADLMLKAMYRAKELDVPVAPHCEDADLAGDGVMNDGPLARRLGLPGIPAVAEEVMVARDLVLAKATGARVHITHLSTAGSLELVRAARSQGVRVTCDVTPHHLVLTEEAVAELAANAKMYPPLRTEADVAALRAGLRDGSIDAIATDHAPHTPAEKARGCLEAPKGIVGLETALALCLDRLVHAGVLSLAELVRKMSVNPARIIGLPCPGIVPGAPADFTVIDLNHRWRVDASRFASKGRNSPFHGWELRGKPVLTMVGGRIVYHEPNYWPEALSTVTRTAGEGW